MQPKDVQRVVDSHVPEIVDQLNTHRVTSEQLVAIFGLRAATIGKDYCMITEDYFEYALKAAIKCDQDRRQSGKPNWTIGQEWDMQKFLPPLFGVPVSVKDNIEMEGTVSSFGLIARSNIPIPDDSPMVVCLKHSGMIPFVKTTLPQYGFSFESLSKVWGRCLNPWNENKTPGGSSSGEAAAVAARVSPIGFGNDMAGSLRIPAHCCGVYGFMVGVNRFPKLNAFT